MKYIIRVLNTLSKIYFILSLLIALAIVLFSLAVAIYYIGIYSGSGFAKYISESTIGPGAELKIIIQHFFKDTFSNMSVVLICFLNGLILKDLGKFLEQKNNQASLIIQKKALSSLPKYIVMSYFLNILIAFLPLSTPENQNNFVLLLENYGGLFIPEFGNALGLVLAFIIYTYSRSLSEQEIVTKEIDQLKQEADLVI